MSEKQILRNQAIAIASMSIPEIRQYAVSVSQSGVSERVKKDTYRLIDKALEILESYNVDAMAVSANINISDL